MTDQEPLFAPEPARRAPPADPSRGHYSALLRATGLNYGTMPRAERERAGRVARALRRAGIEPDMVRATGTVLAVHLGRKPSLGELADRCLR